MSERILKYLNGELTREERITLMREVEKDEMLKKKFVEYQNQYALLNLGKQLENREEGKRSYYRFIKQKRKSQFYIQGKQFMKYAAVTLFLLIGFSLATYFFLNQNQLSPLVASNILFTPAGQRAQLTLQDGTTVWLNANSKLIYPSQFIGKERRVKVEGEAFFNVAKDSSRPFIVSSGEVEMEVLGTQFNVKNYIKENSVQTSLLEGSVRVYCLQGNTTGVILKPSQQVTVSEGKMVVSSILSNAAFLWRDGVYAFENERLESILNKLELYYDVDIVVKDSSILDGSYTGKFRQRDSLDDIFHVLQQINSFKVEKTENNIFVLRKQNMSNSLKRMKPMIKK